MKELFYIFCFLLLSSAAFSQTDSVKVVVTTTPHKCEKGSATIQISGGKLPYTIKWSTGEIDVLNINKLPEGEYSVLVQDSGKVRQTNTTFKIIREECPVVAENHFTPNDDNYNDTWNIYNTQYYPEFELYVFNKWGQQVHFQKKIYTPWNGDGLGSKVADGTYYFVFYFVGSEKDNFLKGDVTILR
ncbi:MAG: gliding motility-associated C-terminal domain-containing protein [Sphingobacteriaceae bacterium]